MTPPLRSAAEGLAAQSLFHTTQWAMVKAAGENSEERAAAEALAQLCSVYWYPLYAFIRRQGFDAHQAEDLTQDFFQDFLQRESLKGIKEERGRFRWFLLGCLKNFLAVKRDRAERQRHGGGGVIIPLESATAEEQYASGMSENLTPEVLFDRQWAFTVLNQALKRLERKYARMGRVELFKALEGFLPGGDAGSSLGEVAAAQEMSLGALTVAVSRIRQQFGAVLRREVERTVPRAAEVDDEIRYLISVLGQQHGGSANS